MKVKAIILIVLAVVIVAVGIWAAMNVRQQPATSPPKQEPLDRAVFVRIYADLAISGEKIGVGTPQYESMRDSILTTYGITFAEFTAMLSALDTQPEEWAKVWEDILAELTKRKAPLIPIDSTGSH